MPISKRIACWMEPPIVVQGMSVSPPMIEVDTEHTSQA